MARVPPLTTAGHPRHRLDDLLTHAVRFSVVAALDGVEKAEFALVRDSVEVSDSVLSKQVALLERAGYVDVEKGRVGRRAHLAAAHPDGARDARPARPGAAGDRPTADGGRGEPAGSVASLRC